MKLLLTAFDPFGGDTVNPALEAVALVPDRVGGVDIVKVIVPTVFGVSVDVGSQAIAAEHPDAVLCIGQAGGRYEVTPERIGINVDDARIPDNAGNQPIDAPIAPGGPPAYFATLPVKAMAQAIRRAGLPSAVSNSAGTFVCNHLMYGVLHYAATQGLGIPAGFMHVPFTPAQVVARPGTPAMSIPDIVTAITAAIGAIEHPESGTAEEGTLH